MPGPNEKAAPRFESSSDPEELEQFFSRLEDLFDKCAVTDEDEKKKAAVSYTDIKTERQWKVLPKYAAGEKYEDFKSEVMDCYDGARDSDRDAVQELKRLVRRYDIAQISDKSQFMEFKREFQVLASALSKVLSNRELDDAFLAPMSNDLYRSIKLQLERLPVPTGLTKRENADPYTLKEIMEAGLQVLQGVFSSMDRKRDEAKGIPTAATATREQHRSTTAACNSPAVEDREVKQEEMGSVMAVMKDFLEQQTSANDKRLASLEKAMIENQKSILSFLQQQSSRPPVPSYEPAHRMNNYGQDHRRACFFCGETDGHISSECLVKSSYIKAGKIEIVDGRPRLPGGGEIPKDIRGQYVKDRIDEYYARVKAGKMQSQNVVITTTSTPGLFHVPGGYSALLQEKQELERQVYAMRSQQASNDTGVRTRSKGPPPDDPLERMPTDEEREQGFSRRSMKAGGSRTKTSGVARSGSPSPPEDVTPKKKSGAVRVEIADDSSDESEDERPPKVMSKKQVQLDPAPKTIPTARSATPEPEMPYINVPDVTNAGKQGGPSKKLPKKMGFVPFAAEDKQAAYRLKAPVEERGSSPEVLERLMKSPIAVTVGELLALSKIGGAVKQELTMKRVALGKSKKNGKQQFGLVIEEESESEGEGVAQAFPFAETEDEQGDDLPAGAVHLSKIPFVGTFIVTTEARNGVPAGALVWQDPFEQYLNDAEAKGEVPKEVYVAKDSQALRSVFPFINGSERFESLYDTGSQIVSMASRVADRLGLIYDPDIVINMQSANKQVEKSLGMAKNIPFLFGDITVYLQVHIIKDPAYEVLLGRPFDTLTTSTVYNTADGGQTIKIRDPNSTRSAMIPTFPRGQKRFVTREVEEGFQ